MIKNQLTALGFAALWALGFRVHIELTNNRMEDQAGIASGHVERCKTEARCLPLASLSFSAEKSFMWLPWHGHISTGGCKAWP